MRFTNETVDLTGFSKNKILKKLKELNIPLTAEEAKNIQFKMLKRPPSLAELILFSIQGSEHCSYKSSRNYLKGFVTESPDVVLGAKEDAGVISIATDNNGERWCIVMSHESHNHPSQLVPYEGAATGVGGNVRDVLCMGAEVIACTDSFRFGNISESKTKWIHEGVVSGVAGYGNPLGVPNIGGDLYYNDGYNDNCLVTLVTLGVVKEKNIIHSYAPKDADGYDLILMGKPTDNSGFGGASFASLELEEDEKEQNKGAVQEPNAFLERHLLKSTYSLFKKIQSMNLTDKIGFKDLGAGGVACASVELADTAGYGAEVWLDNVHKSMENLHPSVYLCSETQERFMWVCPPDKTNMILEHYNKIFDLPNVSSGARASVIGKIRAKTDFIVHNGKELIVNAPAALVTEGFLYDRPFKDPKKIFHEPIVKPTRNLENMLLEILSHENIASRSPVYEKYDKQVQGRTIYESGTADSGVIAPFNSNDFPKEIRKTGLALSTDHNPRYNTISPYWGAVNAVIESMRNVAAVGAIPIALSDCLCFGNPENPSQMWEFVESIRGIKDACNYIYLKEHQKNPIPIIAGNVSFYNESKSGAIPPSPMISCLGKLENIDNAISMSLKSKDSTLFLIGERKNELGGSVYYDIFNELGSNVPKPNFEEVRNQIYALTDCIDHNIIRSCHDISDGGFAVAIFEMSFNNNIGCTIDIKSTLSIEQLLFSETGGFIIEVGSKNKSELRAIFKKYNVLIEKIGTTNSSNHISINSLIKTDILEAKSFWENGLRDKLK